MFDDEDDNGKGETVVIIPSPNDVKHDHTSTKGEDSNKNVRTKTAEARDKNTHLRKMPKPLYILLNLSNIFLLQHLDFWSLNYYINILCSKLQIF
ncbi:hypothetical protein YC2023_001178 [Brassica napus]